MRAALPRLRSRVAELKAVDLSAVRESGDVAMSALQQKVAATVMDVLGADSAEYHQMGYIRLNETPMVMGYTQPPQVVRNGYQEGIARTIGKLETLIALFEEKLGGAAEDPGSRARRAFGDLDLHPEVARAVAPLFEDGHYANAVEDACKVLDLLVKMRSGRTDLSGTTLMQTVFSPKKSILRFNDLKDDSDKSEQEGMMYLYAGAMLALRNPRAHGIVQDSPDDALEFIGLVSLLAKALDRAHRA